MPSSGSFAVALKLMVSPALYALPVTGVDIVPVGGALVVTVRVAAALVARKVGLAQLTDGFVAEAPVREAMGKVRIATVDTHCPLEPVFALTDRVELELHDGRKLDSGEVRFARGNAKLPLRESDLKAKFFDCAAGAASFDASAVYEGLSTLGAQTSLRHIGSALAAA